MSHRSSQEFILDASLIPDAEIFSGYLETMASIERNVEAAPETDVEFHKLALDGVKTQAREFLLARPDLIPFYKVAGRLAVSQVEEQLEREIQSSEQLIGYVKAGLLDSLTIDELESRIKVARLRDSALSHHTLFNAAFGDLLEEPKPEAPKKSTRTRRPTAKPEPETESVIDESMLRIIEQADWSAEVQAFVRASLNGGAKLLTLRREQEAIRALSDEDYLAFKADLTQIRDDVATLFKSKGVSLNWDVTGKTRGTTYRLIAATDTPEAADSALSTTSEIEKDDSYSLEEFSAHLFRVTQLIINSGQPHANHQSYISERIAEWLDISTKHASELVDRQIKYGLLACTGIEKGSQVVEVIDQPVEVATADVAQPSAKTQRSRRTSSRAESKDFTGDEFATVRTLFNFLAASGNHDRGVGLQRLSSQLDISERDLKPFVSRLAKAGVCKITRVLDESASTDKTRKTGILVKFPSRGAWNRFQTNPTDYLSILPTSK